MPLRRLHSTAQLVVMSALKSPPPPSTGGPSGPAYSSLQEAICRQVEEPSQTTHCHGYGDNDDEVPASPEVSGSTSTPEGGRHLRRRKRRRRRSGLLPGHRISPMSPVRDARNNAKAAVPIDYSRYVKRFSSALECGRTYCKDLNYRKHFHCLDCKSKVFVRKEEMLRHFKWHKKRVESLKHGFMRYSKDDDCSDRYNGCSHNHNQTHYHCIQKGCDKVYLNTREVRVHVNYHRKESAKICEGFQVFRATEECGATYCSFLGQRTMHFHCTQDSCKYTFQRKAAMEKHKTYHINKEKFSREGFKKFMKHEICPFDSCQYSCACKHIHCIRKGCNYVNLSGRYLSSHDRKHKGQDSEIAYPKCKLAQGMKKTFAGGTDSSQPPQLSPNKLQAFNEELSQQSDGSLSSTVSTSVIQQGPSALNAGAAISVQESSRPQSNGETSSDSGGRQFPTVSIPPPSFSLKFGHNIAGMEGPASSYTFPHYVVHPASHEQPASAVDLTSDLSSVSSAANSVPPWASEDLWQTFLTRFGPTDKCAGFGQCELLFKEYFQTLAKGCEMIFRSMDGVREHARNHELQEQVSEIFYITSEAGSEGPNNQCEEDCPYQGKEKHYHCTWDNCREVILLSDKPFRRLDHYKMHEYSRKLSLTKDPLTVTHLATSIDSMCQRKRGRPPENRVIEHLLDVLQEGFYSFPEGTPCPEALCSYNTKCHSLKKKPVVKASGTFKPLSACGGAGTGSNPCSSSSSSSSTCSTSLGKVGGISRSSRGTSPSPPSSQTRYGAIITVPNNETSSEGRDRQQSGRGTKQKKSSHFHSLKCEFVCSNTNKVVAHRRQHSKFDSIMATGFQKFKPFQPCNMESCAYAGKQTHYHCLSCQYTVVGLSQMSAHKLQHLK